MVNKSTLSFAIINMKSFKLQQLLRKTVSLFLGIMTTFSTFAQAPGGVPYGNPEPVEWDLFNVILLIIIPVVILLIYFLRKRNKKK